MEIEPTGFERCLTLTGFLSDTHGAATVMQPVAVLPE
jgi:hypothetical protein